MLQAIRRALLAMFSFISSFLGAALGFFLYPLARLYRLASITFVVAGIAGIAIPILGGVFGYYASRAGLGLLPSILAGIVATTALTGLLVGVFPILVAYSALRTIIVAPFEGVRKGWSDGLFSTIANFFRIAFGREQQVENPAATQNTAQNAFGLLGLGGFDYQAMIQQLTEQAANAARQPMTAEEYTRLELSQVEIAALKANRSAPLTAAELTALEPSEEQKVRITALKARMEQGQILSTEEAGLLKAAAELESYKNLQRLKTDNCTILAGRPEREDTIVLTKQYKVGQQWLPVPGVADIFDKDQLKSWFVGEGETRGNAVHPLTRDNVKQPSPHKINGVDHETRYEYHSYYAQGDASEEGLSQELNQLTPILRARAGRRDAQVDFSAAAGPQARTTQAARFFGEGEAERNVFNQETFSTDTEMHARF